WGLSAEDQRKIFNGMMEIAQNESTFNYKGTIYNLDFDYDVTGSLFAIVMDATIQQGQYHKQLRFLAPKVHLNTGAKPRSASAIHQEYSVQTTGRLSPSFVL
ncbi:hypothetical protein ACC717_36890, partial [Rhizobium ruizarguesonis]